MIFVKKNSNDSYLIAFIFVVSGSLLTILYRLQIQQGGDEFLHPLIQTTIMFIGELLCLIYYWVFRKLKGFRNYKLHEQRENQPKLKWNQLILPVILDLSSTILLDINFNIFQQNSVQQTMSGWLILFVLIWSRKIFKAPLKWHHIVASILVLFGSLFSNTMYFSTDFNWIDWQYYMISIILIIFAQFVAAYQFVYQEQLLLKYSIHPFKFVGIQGLIGVIIMIPVLLIAQYTPCPSYYCDKDMKTIEDIQSFYISLKDQHILIYFVILRVLIMSIYNICLISILLTVSAIFMSVIVVDRSIIVYFVAIISSYICEWQWEIVDFWDIFVHILGFGIIILGDFVYFGKICEFLNKDQPKHYDKSKNIQFYTSMTINP